MWERAGDRWARYGPWALIALGVLDRAFLLSAFGFRYIGIDDALMQQVAADYGNGIFREPFLYGQNYNPMLEALLAAPFVRLGAAPWIVLPIVTSLLALLPFWSFAWWSMRRGAIGSAWVFAGMPLLLPVEWGMMTSMPRGFVHGIAWTALVPWLQQGTRPLFKHASTAFALVAALFCNPNVLPLVAGIGTWLIVRHFRSMLFWGMDLLALGMGIAVHFRTQAFFEGHPLVHPLLRSDLHFSLDLLRAGLLNVNRHLMHMHPFGGLAIAALLLLTMGILVLWVRRERAIAFSLLATLLVMLLALGIVKVHEGCDSVFFPRSRMFLSLPVVMAATVALLLKDLRAGKHRTFLFLPVAVAAFVVLKAVRTEEVVRREMAGQSCAYVREEPLADVRERCERIKAAALAGQADLIVPIRWPGIRADHKEHFTAHFACYACEQLVPGFLPVYGAGFDRRSWLGTHYAQPPSGRVLFVGGDTLAWQKVMEQDRTVLDASTGNVTMHIATCGSMSVGEFILRSGVDDDLGR